MNIILVVIFKNFGIIYRPKWAISMVLSSIIFVVNGCFMMEYAGLAIKTTGERLNFYSAYVGGALLLDAFAYTTRWTLIRSFVFQC